MSLQCSLFPFKMGGEGANREQVGRGRERKGLRREGREGKGGGKGGEGSGGEERDGLGEGERGGGEGGEVGFDSGDEREDMFFWEGVCEKKDKRKKKLK